MLKVNTKKISVKDFAHAHQFVWWGKFWVCQPVEHDDVDDPYPTFVIMPRNGELVLCNTAILDGGDIDSEGRLRTMGDCEAVFDWLYDAISSGYLIKE